MGALTEGEAVVAHDDCSFEADDLGENPRAIANKPRHRGIGAPRTTGLNVRETDVNT